MRELKYHVATTVDGFIGHEDGSVDGFLAEGDHAAEFLESPVLFGSGIPLFSRAVEQTALELTGVKSYDNGVLLLRYRARIGQ
jgi:hypothetical protein